MREQKRIKKKQQIAVFIFLLSGLIISASLLFAQEEIPYDPYVAIPKYPGAVRVDVVAKREQNQWLARILEQPFRPVGYVTGRSLQWMEENHLDDKTIWFFDELASHGIYPKPKSPTSGGLGIMGLEGRVEIEKLLKVEQPHASLTAFGGWTPNAGFAGSTVDLGGKYKLSTADSLFSNDGVVSYHRSSSESFYGLGQDTSLGEYSTYQPEELRFDTGVGYQPTPALEVKESFIFQKMNIGNGNRERVGKIKEHFPVGSIPGINGGDLIGLKTYLSHDTRDNKHDPKHGGQQLAEFSYFHDTDGNDFHYLKFGGSISHFLPIKSDRRILALRLTGEKNQELGGGQIPFFNMARLGGTDRADGSELLRSYRYNRFFDEGLLLANAEYRYNIYEYGNFAGDAVALFDVGEVFEEISDFGLDELKFSYGGGLNIKFRRKTLLSFFIARGNEGWRSGTHTRISF